MSGIDLADPRSGTFVSAHEGGVAMIGDREQVLASAPAALSVGPLTGEEPARQVTIGGHSARVDLEGTAPPLVLDGELCGAEELISCRATGLLGGPDGETRVDCAAASVLTLRPPVADLVLRRSILISFADGGLLALAAARPAGHSEHDREETVAVLTGPAGETREASEVLLSTAYDEAGCQRRATLELWPDPDSDERPARGGGTLIYAGTVAVDEWRVETALFRWSVDGRPGLGRYEIARRS